MGSHNSNDRKTKILELYNLNYMSGITLNPNLKQAKYNQKSKA